MAQSLITCLSTYISTRHLERSKVELTAILMKLTKNAASPTDTRINAGKVYRQYTVLVPFSVRSTQPTSVRIFSGHDYGT